MYHYHIVSKSMNIGDPLSYSVFGYILVDNHVLTQNGTRDSFILRQC